MIKEIRYSRPLSKQISELFNETVGYSEEIEIVWLQYKADIVLNRNKVIGTIEIFPNSSQSVDIRCHSAYHENIVRRVAEKIDNSIPSLIIALIIQE